MIVDVFTTESGGMDPSCEFLSRLYYATILRTMLLLSIESSDGRAWLPFLSFFIRFLLKIQTLPLWALEHGVVVERLQEYHLSA